MKLYVNSLIDWIKKEITNNSQKKLLLIWMSGISLSIGIIEAKYFTDQGYTDRFTTWPNFWSYVILFGIIVGVISYLIKGFILYLGIKLSGGRVSISDARKIMVYSGLPIYIATILIEIVNTVVYFDNYFIENSSFSLDLFLMLIKIISTILFFYLLIRVSIDLSKSKSHWSIAILCFIPVLYNVTIFSLTLILIMNGISSINQYRGLFDDSKKSDASDNTIFTHWAFALGPAQSWK